MKEHYPEAMNVTIAPENFTAPEPIIQNDPELNKEIKMMGLGMAVDLLQVHHGLRHNNRWT